MRGRPKRTAKPFEIDLGVSVLSFDSEKALRAYETEKICSMAKYTKNNLEALKKKFTDQFDLLLDLLNNNPESFIRSDHAFHEVQYEPVDSIAPLNFDYTEAFSTLNYYRHSHVAQFQRFIKGIESSICEFQDTYKKAAASLLLKQEMDQVHYNELIENGSLKFQGSDGKFWQVWTSGVVFDPEGNKGLLLHDPFPLKDAILAFYLHVKQDADSIRRVWGCGNLSLLYRGTRY